MLNTLNVIVTQPALFQMLTLCQKYSNLEWSGYCIHEKKGELFNEQIIVHGVYLMDVGTGGATDFKGNADVATLVDAYPELDELIFEKKYRILQCKVHSHHSMSSFFSQGQPSDQQDLEDNAQGRDLYVSIVVNNKMELFARACRWVKTAPFTKTVQVLEKGKYQPYSYEVAEGYEKIVQDCKMSIDMQNPDWFTKRLTEVKTVPVVSLGKSFYNAAVNGLNPQWQPKTLAQQTEINFYNTDFTEEEEYDFEDEIVFVFSLPKKCTPCTYLKKNKIDLNVMSENLSTYGKKAEDEFFDQLAEWVIENDLQESPFFNQVQEWLKYVES